MDILNEMTAHNASVGAEAGQPIHKSYNTIISENDSDFNRFDEINDLFDIDESYLHTVSMTELFDSTYKSKPPIIDGLLYRGTYLFVGSPKIGKSFLMAQLAYHVSTGTKLWGFDVRQGKVLYLALEDDYPRLQKRLYRMFGTAENENLFFSVTAHQLGNGLDEQLDGFLQKHPDTSLVIIDTLQKVREVGGENYSYANDYQIITKLKSFTDRHNICMLVVHHTRKQMAEDKFEMISGTNGLLGAADGAFVLSKPSIRGGLLWYTVSYSSHIEIILRYDGSKLNSDSLCIFSKYLIFSSLLVILLSVHFWIDCSVFAPTDTFGAVISFLFSITILSFHTIENISNHFNNIK